MKKGDGQEIHYYRPISILSFLLKNFGKTDLKNLILLVSKHSILTDIQSGLR
jgi:hypothetical protein